MKRKKKYGIKTFFLSFSSGLQRSTSAGCHLMWHFFSSSANVWPRCGATSVTLKGQAFAFPWDGACVRVTPSLGTCAPAVRCHRNGQTNETSGDFNISRWSFESVRVYAVVTVLYFTYFSVISMQGLTFLVKIWFPTKEAKEVPAMRKYFQQDLKILPWKFTCSNTACFSGTFQWLWS